MLHSPIPAPSIHNYKYYTLHNSCKKQIINHIWYVWWSRTIVIIITIFNINHNHTGYPYLSGINCHGSQIYLGAVHKLCDRFCSSPNSSYWNLFWFGVPPRCNESGEHLMQHEFCLEILLEFGKDFFTTFVWLVQTLLPGQQPSVAGVCGPIRKTDRLLQKMWQNWRQFCHDVPLLPLTGETSLKRHDQYGPEHVNTDYHLHTTNCMVI